MWAIEYILHVCTYQYQLSALPVEAEGKNFEKLIYRLLQIAIFLIIQSIWILNFAQILAEVLKM